MAKIGKESVEILGLDKLDKAIRELTKQTGKNYLAPALRKAANVIRDQARSKRTS